MLLSTVMKARSGGAITWARMADDARNTEYSKQGALCLSVATAVEKLAGTGPNGGNFSG